MQTLFGPKSYQTHSNSRTVGGVDFGLHKASTRPVCIDIKYPCRECERCESHDDICGHQQAWVGQGKQCGGM